MTAGAVWRGAAYFLNLPIRERETFTVVITQENCGFQVNPPREGGLAGLHTLVCRVRDRPTATTMLCPLYHCRPEAEAVDCKSR